MKAATIWTREKQRKLGSICVSAALAVLIGGLASMPARADDDDRGRNVRQEYNNGRTRHPTHHVRRVYDRYRAPSYVYAPPPVYYVAPPRQPAIDFVFPLTFR